MIKYRGMGWARYAVGIEMNHKCIQFFDGGNLKGREHLRELDVDGKLIVKQILGK
jgi:hypothetical protein